MGNDTGVEWSGVAFALGGNADVWFIVDCCTASSIRCEANYGTLGRPDIWMDAVGRRPGVFS